MHWGIAGIAFLPAQQLSRLKSGWLSKVLAHPRDDRQQPFTSQRFLDAKCWGTKSVLSATPSQQAAGETPPA